ASAATVSQKSGDKHAPGGGGAGLVVWGPLPGAERTLVPLAILECLLARALEPLLMRVEITPRGVGELLRPRDRPPRCRYPGVDDTHDIKPVRHERYSRPCRTRAHKARGSNTKDAHPLVAQHVSRWHARRSESKREDFNKR